MGATTADKAKKLTPQERAQSLARRAADSFRAGRAQEAENWLQQALALSEENYEAHYWLGRIYATRAASSPEARSNAIEHFSRALALQPYGDAGALTQAWLLKIGGRPRTLLCAALPRQALELMGGGASNANNSTAIARSLSMRTVGDFSPVLANASAFTSSLRRLFNNRSGTEDVAALSEKSPLEHVLQSLCRGDNLRRIAPDASLANVDSSNAASCGWLALVSVGDLSVTRQRQYKRVKDSNGKKYNVETSPTYSASVNGTLWLYDPIGARMLPAQTLSGMSILNSESRGAALTALNDLADDMNRRMTRLIALRPDPRLLDETLLPTALSGVYVRSIVASNDAEARPRFFFASWNADNSDDFDLANSVGDSVQYSLLAARYTVVSPNSARLAFKFMNGKNQRSAPSDETSSAPSDELICLTARRSGCRFAVSGRLLPVQVQDKSIFIFSKVKVTARFELRVLDAQTGVVALSRTFDKSFKRSQLLGGNMKDKGLKVLPETLQTMSNEISLALDNLEKTFVAAPAVVVTSPQPEVQTPPTPPRYLPPEN